MKNTKAVNEYKQAVSADINKLSTAEINRKYALLAGFCGLTLQEAAQIVSLMAARAQQ